jgi:hypothetical protein
MAQQQAEALKGYQRDIKAHIKIPRHSTALRLKHACWPQRIPLNWSGRSRAASSAVYVRHTYVAGQDYGVQKRNRLGSSRALLQESLHDRFILRQIIGAGIVRLPAGTMLSNRVLIPALANAASG